MNRLLKPGRINNIKKRQFRVLFCNIINEINSLHHTKITYDNLHGRIIRVDFTHKVKYGNMMCLSEGIKCSLIAKYGPLCTQRLCLKMRYGKYKSCVAINNINEIPEKVLSFVNGEYSAIEAVS